MEATGRGAEARGDVLASMILIPAYICPSRDSISFIAQWMDRAELVCLFRFLGCYQREAQLVVMEITTRYHIAYLTLMKSRTDDGDSTAGDQDS